MSDGLQSLTLVLTSRCNLRCEYCYQEVRRADDMSRATLQRALDRYLAIGGDNLRVTFTGGEALLVPDLLREALARISDARTDGIEVECTLFTNGLLLDDDALDLLESHDVALQVSADGVPAAQDLRGAGTFELLDDRLRAIREYRPDYWRRRLRNASVFTPQSLPHLGASVEHFLERDVSRLKLAPADGIAADWGSEACSELERQLEIIVKSSDEHRRLTGRVPVTFLRPRDPPAAHGDDAEALPVCGAGAARGLAVDVDGSVHGCAALTRLGCSATAVWLRPVAQALRIGTIHDDDPEARRLALPERAARLPVLADRRRRRSSLGRCHDCPAVLECTVCPLAVVGETPEDPGRVPDIHCLYQRRTHQYRQEFGTDRPITPLLKRAGLRGDDLRRFERMFSRDW